MLLQSMDTVFHTVCLCLFFLFFIFLFNVLNYLFICFSFACVYVSYLFVQDELRAEQVLELITDPIIHLFVPIVVNIVVSCISQV